MINYAHRGASEYAPENTFASFYLGWQMGANGIETDVQCTKDGVLVLYHDDTMQRLTGINKRISDFTYDELSKIDVGSHKGPQFAGERIPSLEEFVHHFSGKGLHLAMELKQAGIEKEVVEILRPKWQLEHLIITSFLWDPLIEIRKLAPEIRIGFLCRSEDQDLLENMKKAGFYQYCPDGRIVSDEAIDRFRSAGFSIRPWGIRDENIMKRMITLGVDGMTVNFPDKLQSACNATQAH